MIPCRDSEGECRRSANGSICTSYMAETKTRSLGMSEWKGGTTLKKGRKPSLDHQSKGKVKSTEERASVILYRKVDDAA